MPDIEDGDSVEVPGSGSRVYTEPEAASEASKLVARKLGKGYEEVEVP